MKVRFLFVMGLAVAMSVMSVRGQEEQKETLGDKLKKLFTRSTPTPTPRRHHHRTSPAAGSPVPVASYGETPLPTATPGGSTESLGTFPAETPGTQYFEPVRPMDQGPHGRTTPRMIYAPQTVTTPPPTETATPLSETAPEETPDSRPMPSLPQTTPASSAQSENSSEINPTAASPAPVVTISPAVTQEAKTPTPSPKAAQNAAISINQLADAAQYPADVRKLVGIGLDVTTKNLGYKYASADPAKGGMDCSGFIYYVLTRAGVGNVPRDAREQYAWVRKAGNFQAVLGHKDDTFELDGLRPGDLLFWANVSGASHEPEITQIMIYVGREKSTNERLMIGASENGTYKGEKKSGVGVFDFKLAFADTGSEEEASSVFVGYGRFPDLGP